MIKEVFNKQLNSLAIKKAKIDSVSTLLSGNFTDFSVSIEEVGSHLYMNVNVDGQLAVLGVNKSDRKGVSELIKSICEKKSSEMEVEIKSIISKLESLK